MAVMVVGSINVDLVVQGERLPGPGETVTGGRFARHGGGKGANQAVAAARVGADVAMAAAVGDDDFGRAALAELEAEGIGLGAVVSLVSVATGVALIAVDARGENQIAVASGANAQLGAEAVERAVRAARPAVVLLGHEVPEAAVLAGAAAAPGVIVLNPAPARRLPAALLAHGPILTPNASEACELAAEADPMTAARALAARSGAPVLATIGARGALLVHDGEVETLAAPRVDVVDTTGAGDALNGALAAELAAGRPLRDAARFAVTAASLSTCRAGARDGMPARDEVTAALEGAA